MKPIWRRPLDLGLVAFFSLSVVYGFLFSLPEGLGVPVSADSPWPPLRAQKRSASTKRKQGNPRSTMA